MSAVPTSTFGTGISAVHVDRDPGEGKQGCLSSPSFTSLFFFFFFELHVKQLSEHVSFFFFFIVAPFPTAETRLSE